MINDLSKSNSVFNHFVAEIRDQDIQKDRMRFRRNLERIGEVLAYEMSKSLDYKLEVVTTPLGETEMPILAEELVLSTILRAGLPLHQGVLNYFDKADSSFVSAFRNYTSDEEFDIEIEYLSSSRIDDKTVLIIDPMIATGNSIELVYKGLLTKGKPRKVIVISAIASKHGVNHLKHVLPANTAFWLGAIDDELTAKAYIVPGLGDAGDLAFGSKE